MEGTRVLKALCSLASFHPTIQTPVLVYFLVSISVPKYAGTKQNKCDFFSLYKNCNLMLAGDRRSEVVHDM